MTYEEVMTKGELLGYCPIKKSNIYSVHLGANSKGYKEYKIVYFIGISPITLISYTGTV